MYSGTNVVVSIRQKLLCSCDILLAMTWYKFGTPGTDVVHLVQMRYTWYRGGAYCTGVVHLVQVWYTW